MYDTAPLNVSGEYIERYICRHAQECFGFRVTTDEARVPGQVVMNLIFHSDAPRLRSSMVAMSFGKMVCMHVFF